MVIDCEKGSDTIDFEVIDNLVSFVRQYQQKLILISTRGHQNLTSYLRENVGNVYKDYEDSCIIFYLNDYSQEQLVKGTVEFNGKVIALETLVGGNPPEIIKKHIHSDVISILLSQEHKLRIGRKTMYDE